LKSRDSNEIDPNKDITVPMQGLDGNSTHQDQISAHPSVWGENKTTEISLADHHHPERLICNAYSSAVL
jgi:sensor domain CHASE-containing protein